MLAVSYLRKHLGGLDASEDQVLRELLTAAVADVENGTARTYRAPAVLTEYYSGGQQTTLELRHPVVSGDGIDDPVFYTLSGSSVSSWSAISSTDYFVSLNPRLGIQNLVTLYAGRWPFGIRNVKAVYTGGYAAGSEPGKIRKAVASMVSIAYAGRLPGAEQADEPDELTAIKDRWRYSEPAEQVRLVRG